MLAPASVVFVMDTAQRDAIRSLAASEPSFSAAVLVLGDFDPQPIRTRRILDPIDLPREVFDECYARVERCVREAAGAWFGSTAPHSQDNERRGHRSKP